MTECCLAARLLLNLSQGLNVYNHIRHKTRMSHNINQIQL